VPGEIGARIFDGPAERTGGIRHQYDPIPQLHHLRQDIIEPATDAIQIGMGRVHGKTMPHGPGQEGADGGVEINGVQGCENKRMMGDQEIDIPDKGILDNRRRWIQCRHDTRDGPIALPDL
jgi:hypothetical protein